ncbi:protein rolling stone-like isoform X1 [Plodia interpunctella]|uniref:protein rolling stone-like isoform X1 n=1 Tax=Plodia interpunctella TaxID=58824 RepID=UPI00236755FA|nr:protein rolling stone-like isoform X1 [Plodia interpunctella]
MLCAKCPGQWHWWLEHPSPADFYISRWQSNRSALPLLSLRTIVCLYSVGVLVATLTVTPRALGSNAMYWLLYFPHWCFLLIVLTSFFSSAVSAYVYFKKPIDATFGLPWYVKTYWVLYNVTIPLAFLISTFYWGLLKTSGKMTYYNPHPVLDVMLHGTNSLVTLVELVMSAHPSRLIHIFQPLLFSLVYLIFNVTYYYAGGLDPFGHTYIYPVMDWSKPQEAMVVVALTGVFLSACHLIVVAIATLRDTLARRCLKENVGICNEGFAA